MSKNNNKTTAVNYENLAVAWHDGQFYNPASRHRRRIIYQLIKRLDFGSIVEIGCGQPYLIKDIEKIKKIHYTGTDISKELIRQNKKEFPGYEFEVLDITKKPLERKYDLVVASEVLEHVIDYKKALKNIAIMAKKYVLITVPSAQVFPIDRSIGHLRHYKPKDMIDALDSLGLKTIKCFKWGFPFHNFYKYAINSLATPDKMRNIFAESEYTTPKKIISHVINSIFYLNIYAGGFQLVILAERKNKIIC